jgi:hypothetical protein
VALAAVATGLSYAQRQLSTPARTLRRRVAGVSGTVTMPDGTQHHLDRDVLLAPLEAALKTLSYTVPMLAAALLLVHAR